MRKLHHAMHSHLSLVPARKRHSGPVRPDDGGVWLTPAERIARRHAATVLAGRTRASMTASNRQSTTVSLAPAMGLLRMWRGLSGRFGKR